MRVREHLLLTRRHAAGLCLALALLAFAAPAAQAQTTIPELIEALKNKDARVRGAAALTLGELVQLPKDREEAGKAIADLILGPNPDPEPAVRQVALESLSQMAADRALVKTVWAKALKDSETSVRASAAQAIGAHILRTAETTRRVARFPDRLDSVQNLLAHIESCSEAIQLGLTDKEPTVLAAALKSFLQSLETVQSLSPIAARDLAMVEQGKQDEFKAQVEKWAKSVSGLLPALLDAVKGAASEHQIAAAEVVEGMGRILDARPLPSSDTDRARREPARPIGWLVSSDLGEANKNAAAAFQSAIHKEMPRIASALKGSDDQVRLAVLHALDVWGKESASAAGEVTPSLSHENRFVRWAAARALGRMAPLDKPGPAVEALAKLTGDEDLDVSAAAAVALGQFRDQAARAAPALAKAAQRRDLKLQLLSMYSLAAVDPKTAKATGPVLLTALRSSDPRLRREAALLLGNLRVDALEVILQLRSALQDTELEVRQAASEALLKISVQKP